MRNKEANMKKRCAGKTAVLCSLFIVLSIALASCAEEEMEVPTEGKLTITGLDAYNGKKIFASSNANNYSVVSGFQFEAQGSRTNNGSIPAQISSGKATLKVYKRTRGHFESYNGNDQLVTFAVAVVGTIYGFVTVNFTNGVASGVFEPDN